MMRTHRPAGPTRSLRAGLVLLCATMAGLALVPSAAAQEPDPMAIVDSLDLPTSTVGRVTARYSPGAESRAEHLAGVVERAAAFFEDSLGLAFDLRLAVLTPEQWIQPYGSGEEPYGIPWAWVADRLIGTPASLQEGVLIQGDDVSDRRRVDFVTLHEYGHIARNMLYHPNDDRDYLPVWWFDEFLATYFAHAYVRATDPEAAAASRAEWRDLVESREPPVLSLDWGFMNDLSGPEFARVYGWYQNLLNLRAAEVYDARGIDFLRDVANLPWDALDDWTTADLIPRLEAIAPGFAAWAARFQGEPPAAAGPAPSE